MINECIDCPYQTVESLPEPFIFTNRSCTKSTNLELLKFLRHCHDFHPDDLYFLHQRVTEYSEHGGLAKISFPQWLKRLSSALSEQGY